MLQNLPVPRLQRAHNSLQVQRNNTFRAPAVLAEVVQNARTPVEVRAVPEQVQNQTSLQELSRQSVSDLRRALFVSFMRLLFPGDFRQLGFALAEAAAGIPDHSGRHRKKLCLFDLVRVNLLLLLGPERPFLVGAEARRRGGRQEHHDQVLLQRHVHTHGVFADQLCQLRSGERERSGG